MCFLCFFYQVLLTSLTMCFLCFMCFLFFSIKLLSRPFSSCVFVMFLFFPTINFFSSSKVSFLLRLYYALMPFFVFFPVYFLATLFFINFILSFSFSFHGQSCCFDFVTLSSFCPQNSIIMKIFVLEVDSHLVPFYCPFTILH